MSQLRNKSQFYHTLSIMLNGGATVATALRQNYPVALHNAIKNIYMLLERGVTLAEAMRMQKVFSRFECVMIDIGERTGSLVNVCRALSHWFDVKHAMWLKMLLGFIYPLFMYEVTGLVLAILKIFLDKCCISHVAFTFLCWALAPLFVYFLCRCLKKLLFRKYIFGAMADNIPIVGSLLFKLETASFCRSLGICLDSGIGMIEALKEASQCCENEFYIEHYSKIARTVEQYNCPLSQVLEKEKTPREAASIMLEEIANGEKSGTLPESCERIATIHTDEAERLMRSLSAIVPIIFYVGIAGFVIYKILCIFQGYMGQINSLID